MKRLLYLLVILCLPGYQWDELIGSGIASCAAAKRRMVRA